MAANKITARYINPTYEPTNKIEVKNLSIDKQLFIHVPFHPLDISRNELQKLVHKICFTPNKDKNCFRKFKRRDEGGIMKIQKVTIAYHRQKNLRDFLCPSKLRETESENVIDEIKKLKENTSR